MSDIDGSVDMDENDGEMGGVLRQKSAGIEDVVFGIMYTVTKEKYSDKTFDYLAIFIDFMQLFAIIIGENFNWDFNSDHWFWRWVFRFNIQVPVIEQGYGFFLACFYVLVFMLIGSVGLCVFVGLCFKNNTFPYVWPIKLLRFFVSLFFGVFYISSLSIFMVSVDCEIKGQDVPRLETFPDKPCFEGGQLIHLTVAIVMSVLFMIIGYFMEEAQTELTPISDEFMATPSSFVRVREFIFKTVLTIVSAVLSSYPRVQGLLMMCTTVGLYYNLVRYSPYYNETCTKVRALLYAILGWCSFCLCMMAFFFNDNTFYITIVMFSGMLPSAVIGYIAAGWRVRFSRRLALEVLYGEGKQALAKNKWVDMNEVEVFSRVCRLRDDEGELIEDNVDMAEQLLKQGLEAFPTSAYLHIVYSSFLLVLRDKMRQSVTMLDKARDLDPDLGQRFQIFVREREFKQQQQGESTGEGAMDLVSYVEFQKNYRMLLHSHRAALQGTRNFWRQLMRSDVNFRHLSGAFVRMDKIETSASSTYKVVLERYPKSVKLMRSYGRFLEEVKNDPWTGSKYLTEADRIEDAQAEAHRESMFANIGNSGGDTQAVVDDQTDAVCVISILGVIQYTNKCCNKLFGYKKEDLMGKNVSSLMPAPFSQNHNTYLRSYAMTQKAKILGKTQSVVALHKNRYVFPIDLLVTKVEHSGADAFMGVIKAVEEDTTVALLYVTWGGTIMCGNNIFSNALGYGPMELVGRSVKVVGDDPHELESIITLASSMSAEDLEEASYPSILTHKFGGKIPVTLTMQFGGTKDQRILILKIKLDNPDYGMMASTRQGSMVFSNDAFANMLGFTAKELSRGTKNIASLFPAWYSALHGHWMAQHRDNASTNSSGGCTRGRVVKMKGRSGNEVAMHIKVSLNATMTGDGTSNLKLWVLQCQRVPLEKVHADISCHFTLKPDGIVTAVEGSLWNVFGYSGKDLEGQNISNILDVVDTRVGMISGVHEQGPADTSLRVQRVLRGMVEQTRRGTVAVWRAVVRPGGHSPSVLAALTLEQEGGPEGPINVAVCRADRLEGFLEIDTSMMIQNVHVDVAMVTGWNPSRLQGSMLSSLLPGACPTSRMEELMAIPPHAGGIKKNPVGPPRAVTLTHGDGTQHAVTCQVARLAGSAAAHAPDKFYVRITSADGAPPPEDSRANSWGLGASAGSGQLPKTREPGGFGGWDRYGTSGGSFVHRGNGQLAPIPIDSGPPGGMPALEATKDDDDMGLSANSFFKKFGGGGKSSPRPGEERKHRISDSNKVAPEPMDLKVPSAPKAKDDDGASDAGSAVSDDNASSIGGSSVNSDGPGAGNLGMSAQDFARAKRFKKIVWLLQNQTARASLIDLDRAAGWVLVVLFCVHVAVFIYLRIKVGMLVTYIDNVYNTGIILDRSHVLCAHMRVLDSVHEHDDHRMVFQAAALAEQAAVLEDSLLLSQRVESLHHGVFLGLSGISIPDDKVIEKLYLGRGSIVSQFEDTRAPAIANHSVGLWDMGNRFIIAAKRIAKLGDVASDGLELERDRYYVRQNGPSVLTDALQSALHISTGRAESYLDEVMMSILYVLVGEAGVVILASAAVMFYNFGKVFNERLKLFSVFLAIPAPMVSQLATTTVKLDEDEEAEEAGEDKDDKKDEGGALGASAAASGVVAAAAAPGAGGAAAEDDISASGVGGAAREGGVARKRHNLGTNHLAVLKMIIPLIGWAAIVAAFQFGSWTIFHASTSQVGDMATMLRMLSLTSRIRYFAHEAVVADNVEKQLESQQLLRVAASDLRGQYTQLFFDNKTGKSFFDHPALAKKFFEFGVCHADGGSCYQPGHPYHDVVLHGIDNLMMTYLEEAELLSYDSLPALHIDNPRRSFLWDVGYADLHNGLESAADTVKSAATFAASVDSAMQACLLVLMGVVVFSYYNFMFKPFMKQTGAEAKRVAELMSQLPNEKGVEILTQLSHTEVGSGGHSVAEGAAPESRGASRGSMAGVRGG